MDVDGVGWVVHRPVIDAPLDDLLLDDVLLDGGLRPRCPGAPQRPASDERFPLLVPDRDHHRQPVGPRVSSAPSPMP